MPAAAATTGAPPKLWGPPLWTLLHALAAAVDAAEHPQAHVVLSRALWALCDLLPCNPCRDSFRRHMVQACLVLPCRDSPITEAHPQGAVGLVWHLHSVVATRTSCKNGETWYPLSAARQRAAVMPAPPCADTVLMLTALMAARADAKACAFRVHALHTWMDALSALLSIAPGAPRALLKGVQCAAQALGHVVRARGDGEVVGALAQKDCERAGAHAPVTASCSNAILEAALTVGTTASASAWAGRVAAAFKPTAAFS